jgi:uncharacterized protein (DUF433 family)
MNGDPKFRQLEPRGQLVAATGGHSSSRLTADDGPTDIPVSWSLKGRSVHGSARLVRMPGSGERSGQVSGAWVFKGTRTPVAVVFENLEDGMTIDQVMEQFPVTREQVKAVLEFAARSLDAPAARR